MNRYDLPACTINAKQIANWQRIKNKLKLSSTESEYLYKQLKVKLHITAKEDIKGNSVSLVLSKPVDDTSFNNIIRDFIKSNKICNRCKCPELVDNNCSGCGNEHRQVIDSLINVEHSKSEKKGVSKEERLAKKVIAMKQKELERKLEKEREDSAEESTIIVDTQESTIIVDTQEETLVKS